MASAQVLPNSRKQDLLEAGKRRLEEFQKKKAAERAKKASSTSQINASEVSSNEKQSLETELVRVTVSDGAGTSDGPSSAFSETSSVLLNNITKRLIIILSAKISPQNSVSTLLPSEARYVSTASGGPTPSSLYEDLVAPSTSISGLASDVGKNIHGSNEDLSDSPTFEFGKGKLSSFGSSFSSGQRAPVQTYESMRFGSDSRSSSNHASFYSVTAETNSQRSRPSFLDSLNVSKTCSGTVSQQAEPEESFMSNNLKSNGMNFLGSSPFHKPSVDDDTLRPFSMFETGAPHAFEPSVKSSLSPKAWMDQQRPIVEGHSIERKHEFYSPNQNEDFSALEQERGDASSFPVLPENGQSAFDVSSVNLPPDQMQTVESISTLISELALEKEELIESLASESSQCSKMKELNNELSRKLEAKTQRLELLTAQSTANENIIVRQPTRVDMPDNTSYAEEGDEVVERVLGWIMKLFPGGPSKRRTSKASVRFK